MENHRPKTVDLRIPHLLHMHSCKAAAAFTQHDVISMSIKHQLQAWFVIGVRSLLQIGEFSYSFEENGTEP
jgi:hypothetical protein